ncbi:MAG: ABC transporter permease [Chloroflexi bacterium]|nr:ABC transporter permease [Chloroflexota bacterium]
MLKIMLIIASIVLFLHGLIHLMGTFAYMKLGVIQQLPYKTTVLGNRWDLGAGGIAVYGALWAVAAIGFMVVAVALFLGWSWSQPVLVGVTLLSLTLTALDWDVAFAGVILNFAILALIWLGPRITSWFAR